MTGANGTGDLVGLGIEEVRERVQEILNSSSYRPTPQKMLSFIDLTSLGPDDDEDRIEALCQKALDVKAQAVCVYPKWASFCKSRYSEIKLAVVGQHFPTGDGRISLEETLSALEVPVDEVDMLIGPHLVWPRLEEEKIEREIEFLALRCHERGIVLKVILESGGLEGTGLIPVLSKISLRAGADFIKTSTGKTLKRASLEAAYLMLKSIEESDLPAGFKPSGGLRSYEQVLPYFQLAHAILGEKAIRPNRFRLGASSLADALLELPPPEKSS
ncbi:MAG: deoxyribose-phosphate aldolase [Bacteriovoracales bacterium]|nr:deoxyribose-phosphate aldolase [Bacteriovoracales bacterium]